MTSFGDDESSSPHDVDPPSTAPDVNDGVSGRMTAPVRRRLTRGRMIAVAIILSTVVALASGWGLASVFQSSAQRDAATKPPPSSPILATVASGSLVRQSIFSGVVRAENEDSLTLSAQAGASRSVVTGHPLEKGGSIDDGQIVTEVNGRPVFASRSGFPFYRDVGLGDQGPDVSALQDTLKHLGYSVDVDGKFGDQTAAAIRKMYVESGYAPATREINAAGGSQGEGNVPGNSDSPGNAQQSAMTSVFIPLSELVGIKTLPSIALTGLNVGAPVGNEGTTDISLGSTTTKVTFEAAPADLAHIAEGSEVTIDTGAATVLGRVASVTHLEASDADQLSEKPSSTDGESKSTVTVIPSEPLERSSSTVRIVSSETVVEEESLLVPAVAVIDRGDGHQVVVVKRSDGDFAEVEVSVLGTLDGRSAVEATSSDALKRGDEVRVGTS